MIPPNVETVFPAQGAIFTANTVTLEGSSIGILFTEHPPRIWSLPDGKELELRWSETVVSAWSAPAPAVAGDTKTRVEIVIPDAVPGTLYRFCYRSDLRTDTEVLITAVQG